SKTLNIFNLDDEEVPNNIEEATITIIQYYFKKGDSALFTFRLLVIISKEY
ncbi:hypothetical protein GE21DRAFT_1223050, partial [Neurospora crassa]